MSVEKFMNKGDLVRCLRAFGLDVSNNFFERWRAEQLADYLVQSDMPDRDIDNALDWLAAYIAEGIENDAALPHQEKKLGLFLSLRDVSSLTAPLPHESEEIERNFMIDCLTSLLEKATGLQGLGEQLKSYWDAQYTVEIFKLIF